MYSEFYGVYYHHNNSKFQDTPVYCMKDTVVYCYQAHHKAFLFKEKMLSTLTNIHKTAINVLLYYNWNKL